MTHRFAAPQPVGSSTSFPISQNLSPPLMLRHSLPTRPATYTTRASADNAMPRNAMLLIVKYASKPVSEKCWLPLMLELAKNGTLVKVAPASLETSTLW